MAPATTVKKRKHDGGQGDHLPQSKKIKEDGNPKDTGSREYVSLQIVTGSYDRGILHGITTSIPTHCLDQHTDSSSTNPTEPREVSFSDSFLFAAHSSSVRCLDISGSSETGKRTLATGGSDERINLYALSTTAPKRSSLSSQPKDQHSPSLISTHTTVQNPKNRSVGNLTHHDRAITRLHFPPNSNKLFSGSEDNNIAITRTRDWTLLSSIRAPIPKPVGRPSGDTAAPGEVPAGINDFAIHPSQKLMLSVGRGEKCLRLWNLMTGKKAGVLNFDREVLAQVGEGKYSSGEGRRVLWSEDGEAYVVVFERGAVVYGLDSKARAVIRTDPSTKLHQARLVPNLAQSGGEILALSTEDGRILFFDIRTPALAVENETNDDKTGLPVCPCVAQLGGRTAGVSGRIKDFDVLSLPQLIEDMTSTTSFLVLTGSSDGAVRIWNLPKRDLESTNNANGTSVSDTTQKQTPKQVGTLIGTLESGNRITCLGAFVMDVTTDGANGAEVLEDEDINGTGQEDDDSDNGSWDGIDV